MKNTFAIAATRSMRSYASKVVSHLQRFPSYQHRAEEIDRVSALKTDRFADGEMEISVTSSLRGQDVFLFTSCSRNEAGVSVEEAKIELYYAVDALKRSQAERITVFEPFVSSSRSDRITRRNSVGLWVHFKTLSSLGANHIITYQLHSDKSKSILDPTICAIDDVPGLTLLKKWICDVYIRDLETLLNSVRPNWAFCSVDAGGEKLARRFANAFGTPLVVAHKQRDYTKVNTVESVHILTADPIEDKIIWIVDDMVDTASSVETLIRALKPLRPREINLIAVHAILSPPASERLAELSHEGLLNHVVVTDTVHCLDCLQVAIPRLEVVPSTELSAKVIATIAEDRSLGKLMEPFNAETYLKAPRLL